ncbi:MAG: Mechanosensitive channel MscK [Phycisphaerae bacterium]|nr:Mechanosensitive channel MscK [Phycisphaerae bacterium]
MIASMLQATVRAAAPAFGWADFRRLIDRIWQFQLVRIGNSDIVVSQVVFALITLVIGLWVSRRISRWLRNALVRRLHLEVSVAVAVNGIVFYTLIVVVVLLSLQVVSIPLTIFAFLGGAVAIGLGFGAQNIFNNFISGLILLVERPVRIGDFVQVGDSYGTVEEIRYRCTRIRRSDGIDVLVPNSAMIEQNVINWTLTDRRVRGHVRVGLAYGSPTDRVRDLLLRAADGDGRALKDPRPWVIYEDFGDNALVFDLYFWTEVDSQMELRRICSDIRFHIDALFREAALVIAFPQRDVHLDTSRPLDVRMVAGEPEKEGRKSDEEKPA